MRVRELGVQKQAEVRVELHLGVTQLEVLLLAPADGRPLDHGVQHGVDRLAQVLDEDGPAVLQGGLQLAEDVLLAQANNLQVPLGRLLHAADPGDALQLGVDHERPPRARLHDGRVLSGHLVCRQAVLLPHSNVSVLGDELERVDGLAHGHGALLADRLAELREQEGPEDAVEQLVAVGLGEGPHVGDEGRGHEHVAREQRAVGLEHLHVDGPALVLGGKCGGQPLSQVQLLLPAGHRVQRVLLLLVGGVQLRGQHGQLGLQLGHQLVHLLEARVGRLQLRIGLGQRLALGLHRHHNVAVGHNVDHEVTQACRRRVLGQDDLRVEVLHVQVRPDLLEVDVRHGAVVHGLLDVLERLHVVRDVAQHLLLGGAPGAVLDDALLGGHHGRVQAGQQHHGGREHVVHAEGRRAHGLAHAQVLLVQRVQRAHGRLHRRLGLGQVRLGVALLHRHLSLDLGHLLGLHLRLGRLHLHHRLLAGHVLRDALRHRLLLVRLLQAHLKVLLDLRHRLLRLLQLEQAVAQPLDGRVLVLLLLLEQYGVQLQQLQVGLGRGVHVPPLRLQEHLGLVVDLLEGKGQEGLDDGANLGRAHVHVRQELLAHGEQRVLGPGLEPVDHRAVHQRGELLRAVAHVVAYGREGQHRVQVAPRLVDEEVPAGLPLGHQPGRLHPARHRVHDAVHLVHCEQVRDVARGQQVVDEDQEPLVRDLRVR
mmetsp:Transcript_33102/g.52018  ORF Transcript_33102/g.52018 Transcript_33102/m.52018 type:complete len:705 (-) Transcript_33102:2068-4182(-)